ncbi:kinase subunit of RNA polymerase II carboxy-terminal domain kinase I [Ascosphaera acerosa]|nr:kinase subunit of RNA polymerase II carboxy-terminal domain kinase I [Ascosphaera acerosa]
MADTRESERPARDEQRGQGPADDKSKPRYRPHSQQQQPQQHRSYPSHSQSRHVDHSRDNGPPPDSSGVGRHDRPPPSQDFAARKYDNKPRYMREPFNREDMPYESRPRQSFRGDEVGSRRPELAEDASGSASRMVDRDARKRKRYEPAPYHDHGGFRHQRPPSPPRHGETRYRERGGSGWRGRGGSDRHFTTSRPSSREDDFPPPRFYPPKGPASSFGPRGRSRSPPARRDGPAHRDRPRSDEYAQTRRSPTAPSRPAAKASEAGAGEGDRAQSPPPPPPPARRRHGDESPDRQAHNEGPPPARRPGPPPHRQHSPSPGHPPTEDLPTRGGPPSTVAERDKPDQPPGPVMRRTAGQRPSAESPQPGGSGSRNVSPQGRRGSWTTAPQAGSYHSYHDTKSPPRRGGYSSHPHGSQPRHHYNPHGNYPNHGHAPFSSHSQRGGHAPYRGAYYTASGERRFPGSISQTFNTPSTQRYRRPDQAASATWTPANRSAGQPGSAAHEDTQTKGDASSPRPEATRAGRPRQEGSTTESDAPSASDQQSDVAMPPPARQPANAATPAKEGKFSFAFKKATPPTAPKPVPDLAQRMREPQRQMGGARPQPRGPLTSRENYTDDRRDARRFQGPSDRSRGEGRGSFTNYRDRRDDRSYQPSRVEEPPEPVRPKVIVVMKKIKPRPTLPQDYAQSESVYFRKPGNESVIGAGTYGKVFKGIHVYTKQEVAMKKIRMEGEKDGFPITAVREIRLLQHLRHSNVVRLLEVMVEKNECFMVFEYLSHDLTGLINHPTFVLSAAHKKDLARQMFEGLRYLHHRGVLHRDIKAANILISNRGLLKFADFGLARFFSKSHQLDYTNRVITIWYRPPELLLGETRYGPAVDIWGVACVWMEMFTKKAVFPGDGGEISQIDKLYTALGTPTKSDWPDILEMPWFELLRPSERRKRIFDDLYRDIISPAALDLVTQMFQYDPAKRPSAEQALQHPYFTAEEPAPQRAIELEQCQGDWHEFESKAARRERDKELRRIEHLREKEKRRLEGSRQVSEREQKRPRTEDGEAQPRSRPRSGLAA